MAVPDPSQRHGIKLLIEDYPYASDGLLIWGAIQNWVQTYINRYYPYPSLVCNDRELQAWYVEVINVGHAELRYENWWPTLANAEDLAAILTTIIWLASAQHAALNFGQYPYGGYIPNRPPRMRRLIPDENDPEYTSFLEDPKNYFLLALPSMLQSTNIWQWWIHCQLIHPMRNILANDNNKTRGLVMQKWWKHFMGLH